MCKLCRLLLLQPGCVRAGSSNLHGPTISLSALRLSDVGTEDSDIVTPASPALFSSSVRAGSINV